MVTRRDNNGNRHTTSGCESILVDLASYTTSSPCTYHRGGALSIPGLSLSHERVLLFHSSDVSLLHGSITGIVGVNGAGKSSLAQVLASKQINGFPVDLEVEYLAAADDEDGNYQCGDESLSLNQRPLDYIQSRLQAKLDRLSKAIELLECRLEQQEDSSTLESTAQELSDLYDVYDSLTQTTQRETGLAMQRVGLVAHEDRLLGQLSCGWRYKCRLVAAILTHPDLLIVDEPSFLDAASTEWLVEQLQQLTNTENSIVMLVSHKEALLDRLCDRIIHINAASQTLSTFHCGYSEFRDALENEIQHTTKTLQQNQDKLETADKSLKKVQSVLKKREGNFHKVVAKGEDKRFIKGKNKEAKQKADKSAASKLKRAQQAVNEAEHIKHKAKREQVTPLRISGLPASESTLVSLRDVGFKYDEQWVFQNVDASLESNDRVLLTGENGCGKTTLLRLILGQMEPTEGSIHLATQNVLYFPQTALHQLVLRHGQLTSQEFLQSSKNMTETDTRQHLGRLGLAGELALRKVRTLSAGQRVRLWLAHQLLLHPQPSLLILDEMSENVDVESRRSLAEMLETFAGAVLFISHDPDFCETFSSTKIWKLGRHGLEEEYTD